MSELIQKHDSRATIRWKLLTGASAMALTAYVASTALAKADDSDRPTLWIELGGQMEQMQGLYSTPFTAPFMFLDPVPEVYQGVSINSIERPARFAFGGEGKISFQPEDSDWIFSAGIRYGRSHGSKHVHHQASAPNAPYLTYPYHSHPKLTYDGAISYAFTKAGIAPFLDAGAQNSEHHLLVDFSVGKDVGIGLLGRNGSSNLSAGVRLVDLSESMRGTVYARPNVSFVYPGPKYNIPHRLFHAYTMTAQATRSFKGLGPSLSWTASAAVAGNEQDGELMLDWSINAAAIFGRQKAKTSHSTQANQQHVTYQPTYYGYAFNAHDVYGSLYRHGPYNHTRSRKVTVPNLGGSVGLSVKYPNFKVSVGYRYDTFLNAMDTGIDVAKKSNLTFNGPYASISIGLGD